MKNLAAGPDCPTSTMKTVVLNGAAIRDIATFYEEINRAFMANEDWKIADSLDALNDLFYGGFGIISGREPVTIVWRDMERSKAALGFEATKAFYLKKLRQPERYNAARIEKEIEVLEAGGPTFFDIVLEIIADHPNIRLVAG